MNEEDSDFYFQKLYDSFSLPHYMLNNVKSIMSLDEAYEHDFLENQFFDILGVPIGRLIND